ncbi:DUF2905 family protein [Chitinivibrio alkaliphilus]|uniref:DUF2905 domain-containing protein n=1 Tax=Chitinivibrio alkaliphilus ACht1 TaxID=1313304 RepID=U7D6B0_9BACT|nr:DUF2905 family protein [Chitinivibrio alkaliphilus]ERP32054.1 hypothetical protein CALK_1037 [Chitinivibrio alkaliphilus ACht1]
MSLFDLGRLLLISGVLLFILGILFIYFHDLPDGKLWGDMFLRRGGLRIYVPVTTTVFVTLIITLVVNIFLR